MQKMLRQRDRKNFIISAGEKKRPNWDLWDLWDVLVYLGMDFYSYGEQLRCCEKMQ